MCPRRCRLPMRSPATLTPLRSGVAPGRQPRGREVLRCKKSRYSHSHRGAGAPSWADNSHGAPHDRAVLHEGAMAIGRPGDPNLVGRTIRVALRDGPDGVMTSIRRRWRSQPGKRSASCSRTMAPWRTSLSWQRKPRSPATARRYGGCGSRHAPRCGFRGTIEPDDQASLIWTFANAGSFAFACLIPGHYEAGMHGRLTVG